MPQFLRFLVVGVVNTAFSYSVYAGFLLAGVGYALANLMSLLIGILFSFKTQGRFVFKSSDNRLLGRFALSWVVIYGATTALIGGLVDLGLDPYSAGAAALPLSVAMSYLLQRHFVFGRSRRREPNAAAR